MTLARTTDLFHTLDWTDPYPDYRRLRELGPVRRLDVDTVLVTGYDACVAVLGDRRASNDLRRERLTGDLPSAGTAALDRFDSFLYRDPPDHTRIRHVVVAALREFGVAASTDLAARTAGELLDTARRARHLDAVPGLAQRLPARLCGHMFGVEPNEIPDVARWARDVTLGLEPRMTPAQVRARVLALLDFGEYLAALIARHRARPTDDLLSALIRAGNAADALAGDELVATVMLFLAALFGSTVDMVGSMVAVMARNPEQYQRVRDRPELVAPAVEELFRCESPFQLIYRIATEEMTVAGQNLPKGTRLALVLGAANRDPERFADPDAYDVEREPGRHIAFGGSLHNCVGIPYSRSWSRAVLTAMVERFPRLEPTGPFPPRPARAFRGYASVPVTWPPAR